ncbi:hypothetical protein MNB_SV-6-223 [hydrothermal vent metagenome]|uniref:DUF1456 domain-containing protein n=1 Tax=hydrothermal vent metagenome TaxID=652676 RepID=A0A1W1CDM0_9ZZZZ
MKNNEVIKKIIEAIDIDLDSVVEIYKLVDYNIKLDTLQRWFLSPNDDNFLLCSYEDLGNFLDAFIIFKRGASKDTKRSDEPIALTNNLILKKLRVALNLKEPEIEIIFALGEVSLTKQQLSSLFRKEGHKNFKECSDDILISFLDGLGEFYYTSGDSKIS